MPSGALWTLRYNPTVDGRILARSDVARLRADEFVQNVAITSTRDSCVVVVQFRDDQDGPYDDQIRREIRNWLEVPSEPQEALGNPGRAELNSFAIGTPIRRREVVPSRANPLRRGLDYVSTARQTLLLEDLPRVVTDPPYASPTIDQENVTSSILRGNIERIVRLAEERGLICRIDELVEGTPNSWLKPGVWVQYKNSFAEVTQVEWLVPSSGIRVFFKLWGVQVPVQSLPLVDFLKTWAQCEKPVEPLSRYQRILKGF